MIPTKYAKLKKKGEERSRKEEPLRSPLLILLIGVPGQQARVQTESPSGSARYSGHLTYMLTVPVLQHPPI